MRGKILMIDDDKRPCKELQEILERERYQFLWVRDGSKGIRLLERNKFDLIILDLKLPGLHGMDILKMLKQNNNHIKILVFTGSPLDCEVSKEKFIQEEKETFRLADAVLNKPCKMPIMLAKINELIQR